MISSIKQEKHTRNRVETTILGVFFVYADSAETDRETQDGGCKAVSTAEYLSYRI